VGTTKALEMFSPASNGSVQIFVTASGTRIKKRVPPPYQRQGGFAGWETSSRPATLLTTTTPWPFSTAGTQRVVRLAPHLGNRNSARGAGAS
jgi:hypothetical protein